MTEKRSIKSVRVDIGLTQEETAQRLSMPLSTYQKKEQGVTEFTFGEITKLSEIFGTEVSLLKNPAD